METKKTFFEKEAFQITVLIFMPLFSFSNFVIAFIFPKATHYSDYTISHFPNLVYLQNALKSGYGLPFWNSQILSGYPAIANPLSGIWYPGNWLSVMFPLPLGSHLVTILHLILGGIGMYLFLRKQELSSFASFFGAMAFQLMPKLFAHYAAGHISLVQAISLTPWVLFFQQSFFENNKRKWLFLGAAVFYSLVILCDVRWVAYLLLIDLVIFAYTYNQNTEKNLRSLAKALFHRVIPSFLGMLFTAFYLLPFLQYVSLSDRSLMVAADILNYSLPIAKLIGFIVPDMGSYAEYVVYPGLVIWITFLGAFTIKALRKHQLILIISIGIFLVYSVGSSLPFMEWVAYVPGINLLRVPSRMYFLISIIMILISAQYLNEIGSTDEPKKTINLLPQFFTLLFASAMMGLIIFSGDVLISDFYWPVIITSLLFLLFILRKNTNRFRGFFQFSLVILCVIDLTVMNSSQYDVYTEDMVLTQDQAILSVLQSDETNIYRVYSPSYSVEQHLAALAEVSQVGGIDPLHLQSYTNFMEKATGVLQNGYKVSIPAFASGKANIDNIDAKINTEMLGLLNVRYIVSAFPIENRGLTAETNVDDVYIYTNRNYLPRAWVERDGEKITTQVQNLDIEPNQIVIDAVGPGILVLSEIYYPGWQVFNNGQKMNIEPAYDILRSVTLRAGENHIVMKYKPPTFITGLVIAILSFAVAFISILFYKGFRS